MDGIGRIIFNERERAGIAQSELCAGICSIATLSRLEWTEQNIGKWNIDVFLQRLGRSQDKFWTIVHIGDYEIMELRRKIWNCILSKNYEEAENGMQEYQKKVNIEKLHHQFLTKCLGMIKAKRDCDWKGALDSFREALQDTVPAFQIDNVSHILIGRDEMQIILLMAEAYGELGDIQTARQMLEGLLCNIQKKEWDEEELVKIYPKVVSVYIDFLKREDRYEEIITLSQKATQMLVDNGIIYLLKKLLEATLWGMDKRKEAEGRRFDLREEQEYLQLQTYVTVLHEVWEKYGNVPEECMLYCTNVQKDISVSNEIIARCRKLCNLSQEKLSEDICTVEQFSRIENGKCSPKERSYRGLMEKMNQAQERNRFFVNAEEYSLHEKIRKIDKKISGRELKKAAEEWKKIRKEINGDTLSNQQCIVIYDTLVKRYNNEISIEEYIQELERAMRFTMPDFETMDIKNWPLSRNEIFLLNNIANAYYMAGRVAEAKHIYNELWNHIEESSTDRIYHITEYRLLTYNMGLMEGLEHNYDRAKEILTSGIQAGIISGRSNLLPSFLYCLGWVLREQGKAENEEKARHILKQAFYAGNLMQLPNLCDEICIYYEEEWNQKITYYGPEN